MVMIAKMIGSGLLVASIALGISNWIEADREMEPEVAKGPVVLELFTSQGCSSCPPADRLLRELATDEAWTDLVIPLSYHVDYWNYLGWRDPFSKKDWTDRQGDYVQAFGGTTMYTPQMVIQGRDELVGSRARSVRQRIEQQAKNKKAQLVELKIGELDRGESTIETSVSLAGEVPARDYQLVAVVFEKGLSTEVPRGENAGKTLKNDFVVRNLQIIAPLQKSSNLDITHHVSVQLDEGLNASQLGIAVFVQGKTSMDIIGAAVQH